MNLEERRERGHAVLEMDFDIIQGGNAGMEFRRLNFLLPFFFWILLGDESRSHRDTLFLDGGRRWFLIDRRENLEIVMGAITRRDWEGPQFRDNLASLRAQPFGNELVARGERMDTFSKLINLYLGQLSRTEVVPLGPTHEWIETVI